MEGTYPLTRPIGSGLINLPLDIARRITNLVDWWPVRLIQRVFRGFRQRNSLVRPWLDGVLAIWNPAAFPPETVERMRQRYQNWPNKRQTAISAQVMAISRFQRPSQKWRERYGR